MIKNRPLLLMIYLVWAVFLMACSFAGLSLDFLFGDSTLTAQISGDSSQDTTLGGRENDPGLVKIPSGAFDTETSVALSFPSELPAPIGEHWTGVGIPVQIELESPQTRADKPMEVIINFDPVGISEPGEVFVGYYHEQNGWFYFQPDKVDLQQGTISFNTFHFSTFACFKANEAQRIEQFLEKSAVETYVNQTTQAQSQQQVEAMVRKIMQEGAGIQNNRVIEIVVKSVVEQMPGGGIAIALQEMNIDALTKATLETTMSELGKVISSDDSVLRELTNAGSTVGAFSAAAGYFAEGDYEEALRVMSSEIADNLPVISNVKKIGERAVELSHEVVTNLWYNPEVEKAFQVYKNGASGGWFGYNVDPGDWAGLSAQMRGLFAKVQSDYVSSYCNARGINPETLSPERREQIADMGMERLKVQFDQRIQRQEQIEAIKANQKALLEEFAEKQLLMRESVNPMYSGEEDLELLMSRLLNITQRILHDTGRSEIIFHSFDEDIDRPNAQIYGQQIAELARIWYITRKFEGPEQAEQAYQQALLDMGLVEDEDLVYGVKPQKVTCDGEYTITITRLKEPQKNCSYIVSFSLDFWNAGSLGGAEYAGANYDWTYIDFSWEDCAVTAYTDKLTTGTFSGGPNGTLTAGWAYVQLNAGQSASLYYSDEDEIISGTCTISNTAAFSGWNGP